MMRAAISGVVVRRCNSSNHAMCSSVACGDEQLGEHAAVGARAPGTPANAHHLHPSASRALGRRIALRPAAREAAEDDEMTDALRVTHGVFDGHRGALRQAQQGELLEPGGIGDLFEVGHLVLERHLVVGPVGETAAADVVAIQAVVG